MRKANLYKDWYKTSESELVTWHCFGQIGNVNDGFSMIAVVEKLDGSVIEVDADRIQFCEPS